MWPSLKPTQRLNVAAVINPQSATTVQVTGWIPMSPWNNFLATILVGTITATGTVDAKLQQATDASGTGAKDITGKAITQLTATGSGSNKQVNINLKQDELDAQNGFNYVQLSVTPATAAAVIAAALFGVDPVYAPADAFAVATVQQNL